jgi:2-amino-4-hydroxy-6-hydroxymethyldihydropteridine diphosphokinase
VGLKSAYVGLGSNLGERRLMLTRAKMVLAESPGVKLTGASSLYVTSPWGEGCSGQPEYLNAALRIETGLGAWELLSRLNQVEMALGRRRGGQRCPRTIDCDLLLLARDVIVAEGMAVPHRDLTRRAFALAPLVELEPNLRHPVTGLPLADYLDLALRVGGRQGRQRVRRLDGLCW